MRSDALAIFRAGLDAVDAEKAVKSLLKIEKDRLWIGRESQELKASSRVFVVGAGKASAAMARAVEESIGSVITAGLIQTKYGHGLPLSQIEIREAGHPVPDRAGVEGTEKILALLDEASEDDAVFCLLSGGGSALLVSPAEGLTLEDKQETTRVLLESGATIHEINAVRKHISGVKGGRLAHRVFPATLISLILSDVIGDDLDSIASGPTVPDGTTFDDCLVVLDKYGIRSKVPRAVLERLRKGSRGEVEETPKQGDRIFERSRNVIVASNIQAVEAARAKAERLGYHPLVLSSMIEGETREVARVHAAIAKEVRKSDLPAAKPACILSGGETTVTIRGRGQGGRNQEFVLAAAIDLEGWENILVLSAGTDGTDGPTDAAGAVADGRTVQRARDEGLDARSYLRENDSYHFFEPLDDLIITGPTLTNVMDLRIILVC